MRLGDLDLTVNGVRASLGNDVWAPEQGNYFVYVDVTFTNTVDQPQALSTLLQMTLQDAQGFRYSVDFLATSAGNVSRPEGEIAPGGFLRGEVGYQIPKGATGLTWKFSGDVFRLGEAAFTIGAIVAPTATPVPPGYGLDNAVAAGGTLIGSDGTEIGVVGIIPDARQQVAQENQFNDPPAEGNRFYMISVEMVNPSGNEPLSVTNFDFKLIGDNRVVYTSFENRCGLIPDALGGGLGTEIFGGGRVQGNICFEIPEGEVGLLLIHEPGLAFGFGDGPRRYLRLAGEAAFTIGDIPVPTATPVPLVS